MDFMKVIDQTVREIKREVNMKVLKVPEIEQKVLDATNNEPWGPHGSALAEIARATKKFTECQIIMNVLLTRLTDTGRNWRHVYKALAVIEYLMANGSERALDDVLEHTSKISSISGFEYVEPSGKDMGINVRKKVETIMAILNSKDKIQEVRNKAATNRDKYFGLSSTGITYKSSATSSFHQDDSRYGGLSSAGEGETLTDGYKERNRHGVETDWNRKKRDGFGMDGQNTSQSQSGNRRENDLKKGSVQYDRDEDDNYSHIPSSQSLGATPNNIEDDFDDFDPRGSSSTGAAAVEPNKSSLFGDNLIDLMDAPVSVPTESTPSSNASNEVDLFADATFVSATPHVEAQFGSHTKANVDLFAQSALPASSASTVDFFAAPDPSLQPVTATSKSETTNTNMVDPFAAVPLNNFYGSDLFGDFTSHTGPVSTEPVENSSHDGLSLNTNTSTISKPPQKKDSFQVKSGIWADSLSRGLIDLNISAPKKVSLADIGIVGALSDGSDEKEKVLPSSAYMGRAMGVGTSLGRSGFSSSATGMAAGAHFSNLNQH